MTNAGWAFLILLAVLAALLFFMRRSKALLRKQALPATATILRMEGGASGTNSARLYSLTLTWTYGGQVYTLKAQKRCATANMPQQGDKVEILFLPQRPETIFFASDEPLRRDELPGQGKF